MKKILVVYYQPYKSDRNTINEHLYAFGRYSGADVWHYNATIGLPKIVAAVQFDLVIFHYTFLAQRWNGRGHFRRLMRRVLPLASARCCKIAFPQDEYLHSTILSEFFKDFGVDIVFTCYRENDWIKAYEPQNLSETRFERTFTGYVEQSAIEVTQGFWKPHSKRKFDIGYRARKLPYWIGRHSTLKWRLTEEFLSATQGKDLNVDLSNNTKDVFFGHDWYGFLADCRVVLGCEGGASLLDPDGHLRSRVDTYTAIHPNASFDEVEEHCFKGHDGEISLMTLSPRHFEAALTKTTQAMVEGEFEGVFLPDIHYIPIKKDFSNLEEVIKKIEDVSYCEAMAERTYNEIVKFGKLSYADFVQDVLKKVELHVDKYPAAVSRPKFEGFARGVLGLTEFLLGPSSRYMHALKSVGFKIMGILGLVETYRGLRRRLLAWED